MAISVNHIVDRIRRETELVIDELMPDPRRSSRMGEAVGVFPERLERIIASRKSGYIRFVDIDRLRSVASAHRLCLRLERRVGQFIPDGVPLIRVSPRDRISEEHALQLLAAVDIGPARTMQQDIEFGIVQIVDIALRAISPAVNDPTTAISCVDQLSCIVIRWAGRSPPRGCFYSSPHVLRVVIPWIDFNGLLDLAFEQIRHYAAADAAVSLRLMRALGDIASTVADPDIRLRLRDCGNRVIAGCTGHLQDDDLQKLRQRASQLGSGLAKEEDRVG